MYAKNFPTPPKFKFPYQEQQRYSGSLVVSDATDQQRNLPKETLRAIEETAKKLEAARG